MPLCVFKKKYAGTIPLYVLIILPFWFDVNRFPTFLSNLLGTLKLALNIMSHQTALDHGDQIAMIFRDHKPYRAITP